MTLVITAFIMVVALSIATILRLEKEEKRLHFARNTNRTNQQFAD